MKRRITAEQLNDLTEKQKHKLKDLWTPQQGDLFYDDINDEVFVGESIGDYEAETPSIYEESLPLLDIGQMIEIIDSSNYNGVNYHYATTIYHEKPSIKKCFLNALGKVFEFDNLCDALWEAVKSIL